MNKKLLIPLWIWKIMRLSFHQFLLCAILCGASYAHETSGQAVLEKKVSLDVRGVRFKKVLSMLGEQADVRFVYSSNSIDSQRKVTLKVFNQRLDLVLKELLNPYFIEFTVSDGKMISLTPVLPAKESSITVPEFTIEKLVREVSGRVVGENGEALPGVSILLKGTQQGTTTDAEGTFSLAVPKDEAVLVFSFVGYISEEVVVGNRRSIDVSLKVDEKSLEEVVVIGYGTQKVSQVISSISRITAENLDERPTSRVDHAMVGKLAGVQVQEISGAPGRGLSVKVRGVGSITSSTEPLYVVDGFPISSGLDNLNPNDILSIEVLKDAAASAIYGSRASNGVVLVTTKSGKVGKPVFQLDSYYGSQHLFSKVDMLSRDEFIEFAIEERNNSWELQGGNRNDPNNVRPAQYQIDPLWLSDPKSLPDHDWQEIITRVAPVQNYQLSASGGTESVRYYISGNYFDQKGVMIGSDYKRLSFRTNLESTINRFLTLGLNLTAASIIQNQPDGDGSAGPMVRTFTAPTIGINEQTQKGGYNPYYAAFFINPLAIVNETTNKGKVRNFRANLYATVNLLKGLQFRTSLGTDNNNVIGQTFQTDNIRRGLGHLGGMTATSLENYLNENLLTYQVDAGRLSVDALAGFTYQEQRTFSSSISKEGFPDDEIKTLNMGTILSAGTSSESQWRLMSYLSRVNLSWDNKYLISGSLRRDGSSRFGGDNKWGWFPAASVGWRISEEGFLKNLDVVNELKLRASFGVTGNNNIGDYSAIGTLSNVNYVLGTSQAVVSGFAPGSFSNRALGWERTQTLNTGLDLRIFRNRVNIAVDIYTADTKDILLSVPIPAVSGFASALMNIGEVRNSGVELQFNTVNLNGKLKWNTGFNISHNKNRVVSLGANNAPIIVSDQGGFQFITKVGEPIGSYYAFEQAGVFKTQEELDKYPHYRTQNVGDIRYRDVNEDGVIDEQDRTRLGSNHPRFFWGLQNSFTWNGFDLAVSMDGQWGNKLVNLLKVSDGQSRTNVGGYWRDRWRSPENPGNGWVPRAAVTANLTTPSNFWMNDASFVRMRTISLGYTVSGKALLNRLALSGLRVYASIDNVFMIDDYNHNPQTGTYSNTNTKPGADFDSTYPLARTYTFGINLKF